MAEDPVCSTTVDEETAEFKSEYQEKTFYFCGADCKKAFDANPDMYAGGGGCAAVE